MYYPGTTQLLGERSSSSGAGPVGPAGAGVGGCWSSGERCGGDGFWTTLRARSVAQAPSLSRTLRMPPLGQ